jgi:hypothetical protein
MRRNVSHSVGATTAAASVRLYRHRAKLLVQHAVQAIHHLGVPWIGDDVVILGGVGAVVVKFGGTVASLGEAPALGADGAAVAPFAEGAGFAFDFRVMELWEKAFAIK